MRHYWSLVHSGGIYVEACQLAGPSSFYFSGNSRELLAQTHPAKIKIESEREFKNSGKKEISNLLDEIIDKIELEQALIKQEQDESTSNDEETQFLESEEAILRKYSFLIERFAQDDPFKFLLKINDPHIQNLTFRQIEILIKNEIQLKHPHTIDQAYLNSDSILGTSNKWWICSNVDILKQLLDCLCKRGYREKSLAKNINKLNEDNYNSSNDSNGLMSISLDNQMGQDPTFYQNRYLNSVANLKM